MKKFGIIVGVVIFGFLISDAQAKRQAPRTGITEEVNIGFGDIAVVCDGEPREDYLNSDAFFVDHARALYLLGQGRIPNLSDVNALATVSSLNGFGVSYQDALRACPEHFSDGGVNGGLE